MSAIYDPTTQTVDAATGIVTRQPFPSNQIPSTMLDPVAKAINQPRAVRAVAHACATNPVAIAIPCHRVLRSNGDLGGYRWGLDRKKALLQMEASAAAR